MTFVILPTKVNALSANVFLKQVMVLVTRDLVLKNQWVHQAAPHSPPPPRSGGQQPAYLLTRKP